MPRLTVRLDDEHNDEIERLVEDGKYDNKSEALRGLLDEREQLVDSVADLRRENERLHRERRQLLEQREEHDELVRYVSDEVAWREAGLARRARWWLFGRRGDE
jgi:Arc/MetJ-type ribon-helix-helix transcriptional regulator